LDEFDVFGGDVFQGSEMEVSAFRELVGESGDVVNWHNFKILHYWLIY
jgi:hypothetical protein